MQRYPEGVRRVVGLEVLRRPRAAAWRVEDDAVEEIVVQYLVVIFRQVDQFFLVFAQACLLD